MLQADSDRASACLFIRYKSATRVSHHWLNADQAALRLHGLESPRKRLLVRLFVDRQLLQFRALAHQLHGAVEDVREAQAVVPQALHADGRTLAAPARPALEQVEEAVEQLAVGMAQELIANIAEFGRISAQRLGCRQIRAVLRQRPRGVLAHLA